MNVTTKILGLSQLVANVAKKNARIREKAAKALNDVGKEVFAESQRRVPVDTSNLKGSGRIDAATPGARATVRLSYGGSASEYAIVVHETHKGKSKYLEAPARENAARFNGAITVAVRSEA